MLVDSHCHLDFPDFAETLPDVVGRAVASGVMRMVTICTKPANAGAVRAIAEAHDPVWWAAGVHPLYVGEQPLQTLEQLTALADHPKMVGIGESGLDYHHDGWPPEMQAESFRTHIRAARETGLPLIVHAREADDDVSAILREGFEEGPYPCVMHCFSSGRRLAEAALEMGFYLSISGVATFRNAEDLRAILRDAPRDRLLVETDAPYLAPVPKRGRRNEPAFVVHTARAAAELLGMEEADFARLTTDNFHRLFAKVPRALPEAA